MVGSAPVLAATEVSVVVDEAVLLPPTSAELRAGECLAVLGPNGAGKTTLLRALAGRVRVASGDVRLRGAAVTPRRSADERRADTRREIAALIEPPALYPDLTLVEQLDLVVAAWAGSEAEGLVPGLGADALDLFTLAPLANRFPHELSSGQRQLISLAVTFARPANVLLLDEPEQRLDPRRRELVARAILEAKRRGTAVACSSHAPELVDRIADRRVRVGDGE